MLNYLDMLGVGGLALLGIVVLLAAAELIKAGSTVFGFLASKFLGIKTKYSERKELDELTVKNRDRLDEYVDKQDKFNETFQKELESIKEVVEDTSELVLSNRIENMRNTILDFASAIANGRIYTKEQFRYVMKVHRDYEALVEKKGLTNDEVEISFKIIEKAFEYNMSHNQFIEDKLNKAE